MRRKILVVGFVLTMILAAGAQADILGECLDAAFGGGNGYGDSPLCAGLLLSTLPISPFVTTTEGVIDDRAVYIQQVREDAADFVATDGGEGASAVLNEAIDETRAMYPQARELSDLEIAKALLR